MYKNLYVELVLRKLAKLTISYNNLSADYYRF